MMESFENSRTALDELDTRLVKELEQDARVSYATLASKLGTSPPTVRRRLNRLVDSGVILIGTLSDHVALGYRILVVFGINAAPGTVNTIAGQLASINRTKYICLTAGRYDILAVALFRSPEEYMRLFPVEIGSILGNARVEIMLSARSIKRSWSVLTHTNHAPASSHLDFTPTDLDLSVIKGLEKFPRASVKELAEVIGGSVSSVRFSLSKLYDQEIVRTICIPDPAFFGYTTSGITLIKVHPSNLKTLTDELKRRPPVKLVSLTFGAFDCMVWSFHQNTSEMHNFVAQDLGNMPGVIHYETLVVLSRKKRSFTIFRETQDGMNDREL